MKVYVHEAKTNLSELIARAQKGEEIIISRGPIPVARLVPIAGAAVPKRQPGTLKGLITIHPSFHEPLSEEELDLWEGKDRP